MKQFIIYTNGKGLPSGYEVETTPEEAIKILTDADREILRPYPLVANDENSALANYEKASQLRQEGSDIAEKGKSIVKDNQSKIDEEERANAKIEGENRGKRLLRELPAGGVGQQVKDYAYQIATGAPKYVQAIPPFVKDITKRYILNDKNTEPFANLATNMATPYGNQITEDILGDPTLVPSLMIPGVGEERAAQIGAKLTKGLLKADKIKPIASTIANNAIQGVVTEAPDIATGNGDVGDIASNMLIGSLAEKGIKKAGEGAKKWGERIVRSKVKGYSKGRKGFESDEFKKLMGAKTFEGNNVIKPFSNLSDMLNSIDESNAMYQKMQAGAISNNLPVNYTNMFDKARAQIDAKFTRGDITDIAERDKLIKLIDDQEKSIYGRLYNSMDNSTYDVRNAPVDENEGAGAMRDVAINQQKMLEDAINARNGDYLSDKNLSYFESQTGRPKEESNLPYIAGAADIVHRGKVQLGKLGRYDVTSPLPNEQRDTYRMLNQIYSDAIGKAEDTNIIDVPKKQAELDRALKNRDSLIEYMGKPAYDFFIKTLRNELDLSFNKGNYKKATEAMAQTMPAYGPIDEAIARNERNNVLGISSLFGLNTGITGAMASAASGHSPLYGLAGAALGATIPMLNTSVPFGTALYRGGEKAMDKSGRYAIPLIERGMQTQRQEE